MEILDQHHILLSLSMQVSKQAVSCQCLPAAECRLLAVMLVIFLSVTFVTALPHSLCLLLCLSPMLTSFISLSPLPFSLLFGSFPSHQPSVAVRGYHSSKAAAMSSSLGSGWTTGSSGGHGAWSGPSLTHASLQHYLSHQQQPHHHHQSTHTSYAYCPAHTAVSTPDVFFLLVTWCSTLF